MSQVKITCFECGETFKLYPGSTGGAYICRCGHMIHIYVDEEPATETTAVLDIFDERC